jgi:glucose/arabinose dehydrogenase
MKRFLSVFVLAVLPLLTASSAAGQAGIVRQVGSVTTDAGSVVIKNVAGGLIYPCGLTFLPDGRLLVTERSGSLRILAPNTGSLTNPSAGPPTVFAQGQGRLRCGAPTPTLTKTATFIHAGTTAGANRGHGR